MKLFFITNSVELARFALDQGVDRIFVDLEINGKPQRQGHLNTVISRHSVDDVARMRPHVPPGALLVRINPLHQGSADEIGRVLAAGADIIMLPMFRSAAEAASFVGLVGGRARTSLLVETVGAMHELDRIAALGGIDEVHIGLNDLHLELGKAFMFEPLADGLVDTMAGILVAAGIPFGIGGVARVGEGLLPAELILAEHARLGSSAAILSRTFHRQAGSVAEIEADMDFALEIGRLRRAYASSCSASPQEQYYFQLQVGEKVRQIAAAIGARRAPAGAPANTVDA